jgi:hypothetical protein
VRLLSSVARFVHVFASLSSAFVRFAASFLRLLVSSSRCVLSFFFP